jgi:ubiquinone/menaquinone biosynthesis C-methylase UbiE
MLPEKKDDSLMDQYRCPNGVQGRAVAGLMNQGHFALSTWGLKHVKVEPNFIVLDVGCGGGRMISRLARRAFEGKVFGIDYSATMVDYSRKVNRRLIVANLVEIVQGSVEKMGFREEFFDLVTAIETYYFWPDLSQAFREILRVLKGGGYLLMVNEMVKDGIYEVENAKTIAKAHVRLLPLAEIQRILLSVGFVKVNIFTKTKSNWNAILAQKS